MVVAIRSLPPSGVETSLPFAIASPPRDRMKAATCSATVESFPNPDTSVPRSFTTTRAPRSARSSTYARPSPRPAPVTTATLPSNEIRSGISLSSFRQQDRSLSLVIRPDRHSATTKQQCPSSSPVARQNGGGELRFGGLSRHLEAPLTGEQGLKAGYPGKPGC